MKRKLAPILIFAYNRPDRLSATLHALSHCPEFINSDITILIDGPKSPADAGQVNQVHDVVNALAHPKKTVRCRARNMGLKGSILDGVTDALTRDDKVIILEDDLIVSPHTLDFFNQALDRYAKEDRVWSISGYMYDVPDLRQRQDAFFVPFPHPWGWATWKAPWQQFIAAQRDHAVLGSQSFRSYFDVLGLRDFSSILELDDLGLISSWYINWYLEMFLNGGITLAPPVSLVRNTGMGAGTHASPLNPYRFLRKTPPLGSVMPDLPSDPIVDFDALDAIRRSGDVRVQKLISRLGQIKRHAKSAVTTRQRKQP